MTRIDPNRLAEIFRQLTLEKTASSRRAAKVGSKPAQTPATAAKRNVRDPETLRNSLRQRLLRLKQESPAFAELAPEVAVREVLIWEFGESVLNHPQFGEVASSVTMAIRTNRTISAQLRKLIAQVTAEPTNSGG